LLSVIPVLALNFPVRGISAVASALLQRKMRFRDTALITVTSYVAGYSLVAVSLAMLGFGIWALVFGQLAQSVLNCAGYLWFSRPPLRPRLRWGTVVHLLRFGGGYSLAQIGNFIGTNGDNFLVGRLLGAAPLGIYSRAYQFLSLPTSLLGNITDQVLFAAMAEARDNEARLARAYERALAIVVMVMLPGSAILVVLAPHIVLGLLGPHWAQAILPFQLLATAMVCRSGYKVSDALWRAKGIMFAGAWRQWLYAGEVLTGAWIGSAWGVNGVAVGVGIAITLHYIVMLIFARQMIHVSVPSVLLIHFRYAVVAGACGLAVWPMAHMAERAGGHLMALLAGGLAGAATIGLLWFVTPGLFGAERPWLIAQGRTILNRGTRKMAPE
jgi:O-antigen/teichoic acid export membrane protein